MNSERAFCAPKDEQCLRCQTVACAPESNRSALLLGPLDRDVEATIQRALDASSYEYKVLGPLLILSDVRADLSGLATLLRDKLSPYTQNALRCAYAPNGADTLEAALGALLYAEPLTTLLARIEHEWIRDAFAQDWFTSVFHPIIEATSQNVFAYEALIRARHPRTGDMIGAGPIIKACETLNIQHQLDQRARRAAIHNAAALNLPKVKFFINFLPNTIYDPEICLRTTMQAAHEAEMPVDRLVFEVVETEQIPDLPHLRNILDYYRSRGVGTAVDDMGAGFSSMHYLTALHPDYVKLDRDIVVQAERDRKVRRQLDDIIALARKMDIRVIAEGIETPEQMQVCLDAGVDYLQGFLFAKPANPPASVRRVAGPLALAA